MKSLLLLLLLLFVSSVATAQQPRLVSTPMMSNLRFELSNIRQATGRVWVGVYTSEEDFLDREKARLEYFDIQSLNDTMLLIEGLEVGKAYALGIFHDVDGNNELNTNFLGLPSEPWAFSQPIRSYFRAPRFGEMSFTFAPEEVLRLRLR